MAIYLGKIKVYTPPGLVANDCIRKKQTLTLCMDEYILVICSSLKPKAPPTMYVPGMKCPLSFYVNWFKGTVLISRMA